MNNSFLPKVSVCMLAYNNADFVEQAIESVLDQIVSFDVELVVCEDASTDDVATKIKSFKNRERIRINAHFNEVNLGLTANFAAGISRCTGEYIAILDNDDYWTDDKKLQKQVEYMEANPKVSICYHPVQLSVDGILKPDEFRRPPAITDIRELAKGNFISSQSIMVRASAFEGFPPQYFASPVNDYFYLMLLAKNGLIGRLDECMAVYRIHSRSDWSSRTDQDPAILKYLECMIGLFDPEINDLLIKRHKKIASKRLLALIDEPGFDDRVLQSIKYGGDSLQIVLSDLWAQRSWRHRMKRVVRKLLLLS